MSILVSFGRWGGFSCMSNFVYTRVCVGWCSLFLYWCDMDMFLGKVLYENYGILLELTEYVAGKKKGAKS